MKGVNASISLILESVLIFSEAKGLYSQREREDWLETTVRVKKEPVSHMVYLEANEILVEAHHRNDPDNTIYGIHCSHDSIELCTKYRSRMDSAHSNNRSETSLMTKEVEKPVWLLHVHTYIHALVCDYVTNRLPTRPVYNRSACL